MDQKIPLISPEFNLPHFEQSLKQTVQKLWTDSARYRFNVAITDRRIEVMRGYERCRKFPVSRPYYDRRMSVLRTILRGTLLALLAMAAAWGAVEVFARQFT